MATLQMELLNDVGESSMTDNLKSAVLALRQGKIVLLLDAHDRENEGDLIVAAEKITPASMNFLIKKGSGIVCLALPKNHLDHLGLPLMIPDNTNFFQTAFTVSMEARSGITTGVSAKDRAHTILTAMADDADPSHLARPGHVFPLAAAKNGVFDRLGHTEGSTDLMKIAGLKPGAVLCELMNDDGSMTMGEDRVLFAKLASLPVVSIEEIVFHRYRNENVCEKISEQVTTRFGTLMRHSFRFFDTMRVEIFHKNEPKKSPARLSLVSDHLLEERFINHILYENADDPAARALNQLQQGRTDMVLMPTPGQKLPMKTRDEENLRQNAMICRALIELSVLNIRESSLPKDLVRIAENYFFINIGRE